MTRDDIIRMALEALVLMRDKYEEYACPACDHADAAIYALRAALEQDDKDRVWIEERKAAWAKDKEIARKNAELERERHYTPASCDIAEDGLCEALECCKEQSTKCGEPVAWRIRRIDPVSYWTLIYQRSPTGENFSNMEIQPLYTHPSSQRSENLKSREWRGLTEEEIDALIWHPNGKTLNTNVEYARAIDAALKEKNHE